MELHSIEAPITTYEKLVAALQTGVQLELGVIPPYFTAMYSVKDWSSPAFQIMRSVLMEEMLHLALNCNLLNAIGVKPSFAPSHLPSYPLPLPHYRTGFNVSLEKLSPEVAKNVFMTIEKPSWLIYGSHEAAPAQMNGWETLGQFYKAIVEGFGNVFQNKPNLFLTNTKAQYGDNTIYANGGGTLKSINNLSQAIAAIVENMDQTQGYRDKEYQPFGPDGALELSHYRKFESLATGAVPIGEAYPMIKDIKPHDLPEPIRSLSILFNDFWGVFVRALGETFSTPLNYHVYFTQTMWLMKTVFPKLAILLMSTPAFPNDPKKGNAGPSFDYSAKPIVQVRIDAEVLRNSSADPKWKEVLGEAIAVLDYMMAERKKPG
ncbi:MAG: hypothetical protein EPO42_01795 [Gallionellaceae bacterium]|nr:MAG: hypothetical protein EPO42_01795 [Gallionellaceae bacterium]